MNRSILTLFSLLLATIALNKLVGGEFGLALGGFVVTCLFGALAIEDVPFFIELED